MYTTIYIMFSLDLRYSLLAQVSTHFTGTREAIIIQSLHELLLNSVYYKSSFSIQIGVYLCIRRFLPNVTILYKIT